MPELKTVVVGAGGNSRVLIDSVRKRGDLQIVCIVDDDVRKHGTLVLGVEVRGSRENLSQLKADGVTHAINGVGSSKDNATRNTLFRELMKLGFQLPPIVHPSVIMGEGVTLGLGALIMAGVVLNPLASVGANVLVNTGSIVEHDCVLADDVFVAPGCVLAGGTCIGKNAFVGVGARTIQGITVGESALVAAGAVLIRDVPAGHFAFGVPAQSRPR